MSGQQAKLPIDPEVPPFWEEIERSSSKQVFEGGVFSSDNHVKITIGQYGQYRITAIFDSPNFDDDHSTRTKNREHARWLATGFMSCHIDIGSLKTDIAYAKNRQGYSEIHERLDQLVTDKSLEELDDQEKARILREIMDR